MFRSLLRSCPTALALVCTAESAAAAPLSLTHVACVGDSITYGVGASRASRSYPARLQALLGRDVEVRNFGNSGATVLAQGDKPYSLQDAYEEATDFVRGAGPDAVVGVVVVLGTNDSKPQNWEPAGKAPRDQQFLEDYRALVRHFLALPTKPLVFVAYPLATGKNPCCNIRGDVLAQLPPLIAQVAQERHLPIVDLYTPTRDHPEYFPDGVHPNDAGHELMANLVKTALLSNARASAPRKVSGHLMSAGCSCRLPGSAGGRVRSLLSTMVLLGLGVLRRARR